MKTVIKFSMEMFLLNEVLINLNKKIEDVVMNCTLEVGNSDFNELVKKVKLILQNMNSFFNVPFSQVIEKRISWDCEERCDHRE